MLLVTEEEYRKLVAVLDSTSKRLRQKIALREPLDNDNLAETEKVLSDIFKLLLLDSEKIEKLGSYVSFAIRDLDSLEYFANETDRNKAKKTLETFYGKM